MYSENYTLVNTTDYFFTYEEELKFSEGSNRFFKLINYIILTN